jgi:hypothetical protein
MNPIVLCEGDRVAAVGFGSRDLLGTILEVGDGFYVIKTVQGTKQTPPFDAVEPYNPHAIKIGDLVRHREDSPAFERLKYEGFEKAIWEVVEVTPNWVRVVPKQKLPFSRTYDTSPKRRFTWAASCFEVVEVEL